MCVIYAVMTCDIAMFVWQLCYKTAVFGSSVYTVNPILDMAALGSVELVAGISCKKGHDSCYILSWFQAS